MKKLAILLAVTLTLQSVMPVSAMESGMSIPSQQVIREAEETVSGDEYVDDSVSVNSVSENSVSENSVSENEESDAENTEMPNEAVSGNEIIGEESVSGNVLSETPAIEDFSAAIDDYEQNATELEAFFQDTYYYANGNMPFFVGGLLSGGSLKYSSTAISDVYVVIDGTAYSFENLTASTDSKAYYSGTVMSIFLASVKVEANASLSRDIKVYFTYEENKYKLAGQAKFIDDSESKNFTYDVEDTQYFSAKAGSKIQRYYLTVTAYAEDSVSKLTLVPNGSSTVAATAGINTTGSSKDRDTRYKTSFTTKSGSTVYLYSSIIPSDVYSVYCYGDINITKDLAEGYYDAIITTKKGSKYCLEKAYYATTKPYVYGYSQTAYLSYDDAVVHFKNNKEDYVAVFIYGLNIDSSCIPTLYDASYEKAFTVYDADDPNCGYEPAGEWGGYYVVKKNSDWIKQNRFAAESENTINDSKGSFYYFESEIYLLEPTDNYIRVYIADDGTVSAGDKLTWKHSRSSWNTSETTLASEEVTVKKNDYGMYVEVGTDSKIFKSGYTDFSTYTYYVTLLKGTTPVAKNSYYEIPEIKSVSKVTVPSGCKWEIHPITKIANVLYEGTSSSSSVSVLNVEQMSKLHELGSFRVCVYNADGSVKEQYLAYSTVEATQEYSITYVLNGGTNHPENPASYMEGSAVTLKDASKPYATFAGWYSDEKLTKKVTGIKASDKGDKTFYAKWTPYTYTVKFDANGGSGTMKDASFSYGTAGKLPANAFKKTGCAFTGWSTAADNSEVVYKDQEEVLNLVETDKGSITLYAQWETANYRIIYHLAGGINNPENATTFTINDTVEFLDPSAGTIKEVTFEGWYKDNTYKTPIIGIEKGTTGDVHVYAKWVANTYTIHFDANAPQGATVTGTLADVKAPYYADIILPQNTYKCKGYAFAGWDVEKLDVNGNATYKNGESVKNLVDPDGHAGESITLYAVWKNQFEIQYVLDGGNFNQEESVANTYQYGVKTVLPIPTKAGYTFVGWYQDSSLKKKITAISASTQGDLQVYAKWTSNKYKVAFKGNGSTSGKMKVQTIVYGTTGSSVRLYKNAFVRNWYTFKGWKGSDGNIYTDGQSMENYVPKKNNETLVLEALWEQIDSYPITYYTIGGNLIGDIPYSYSMGDSFELPGANNIEREGYTFGGWYLDDNYKKKITKIDAKTVGHLVLYAKWNANYTVYFHSGDAAATGTMAPQAMKYEEAKALTKNKFSLKKTVNGKEVVYGFTGWTVYENGAFVKYKDGEKVFKPTNLVPNSETGEKELHLYAKWQSEFVLRFHFDDATMAGKEDVTYTYYKYGTGVTKQSLASYVPVRNGYVFAGWYNQEVGGKKITSISAKEASEINLYARWKKDKYTVIYQANATGVTGRMGNQKMEYKTLKALNKCNFKRKGYSFAGWSTEADGDVRYANQAKIYGPDKWNEQKTLTLYAVWRKDVYSITYNNVSPEFAQAQPDSYQVDSELIVLEEPTKIGSTFLGWYTDPACKKSITEIKPGSTGNLTLYAKWKVN